MNICDKCGREKIMAENAVTGFTDCHVSGSRIEYCGFCDDPPVMTLDSHKKHLVLEKNATVDSEKNGAPERDYEKEPVWKLRALLLISVIKGTDEWMPIKAAIDGKTGSGRPPKRRWY